MIRGMTDKGLLTNPPMIYRVLGAITSSIETNPEFAKIEALQNFALSLGGLSPAKVKFVTLPYELKDDGNVYWTTETDELWTALRTDQPWPPVVVEPTASSSPTPASTAVATSDPTPSEIKVAVLNATTTVGRGSTASEELKAQKFDVIKVGNSTKRLDVSEILYTAASEKEARVLGAATGITTLTLDATLVSPVVLLVGTDWKDGKVTAAIAPAVTAEPTVAPSPTADPNAGTAASTVCTEGNNRVKK